PIGRLRYPLFRREEDGLDEHDAADLRETANAAEPVALTEVIEPTFEVLEGRGPVAVTEAFPGQPIRQPREARHIAQAANRISGRFKLEEKRRTRCPVERVIVRRAPEVDLIALPPLREKVEPVAVCDRYPAMHGCPEPGTRIRQLPGFAPP